MKKFDAGFLNEIAAKGTIFHACFDRSYDCVIIVLTWACQLIPLRKHAYVIYCKFSLMKIYDIFLIFAQNIDLGYGSNEYPPQRYVEAVLTSTHNLCFRAKIRKIRLPL